MMERVDMVLVGAEAVVESGGIINHMGTFQVSPLQKPLLTQRKPIVSSRRSLKENPENASIIGHLGHFSGNNLAKPYHNLSRTQPKTNAGELMSSSAKNRQGAAVAETFNETEA